MNPFKEKSYSLERCTSDWKKLYPTAYNKHDTDAYTKVRTILLNGTEFEQCWFMHNLARNTTNNDLRRDVGLLRRMEQQQQKRISFFKPKDESMLETTISYEQLAVDLTAILAQNEKNKYVKAALDFALLEDFDHLYRFSDLLEMEQGVAGEKLVGSYTEIMPGRPTIAEHRHPFDDVRRAIPPTSPISTKLNTMIITAAEQQTMNFYMNLGTFYPSSDLGRKLFLEIGMVEEQHVTQYESLMDSTTTPLECLLMHEYAECYLYYSAMTEESNDVAKKIWTAHFEQELSHLHYAVELLQKYEKKEWAQVIPDGEFPKLLTFNDNYEKNKNYIRNILKNTITNTAVLEEYTDIANVPDSYEYFRYNNAVNKNPSVVASHKVIDSYIAEFGEDYRYTVSEHPVKALRNRKEDNIDIGRKK
ncbi:MAG: hypothetical protein J1F33_04225 [Clostridiales bacterium]|nr:hypothetical protein [Clostridiales bacterium]